MSNDVFLGLQDQEIQLVRPIMKFFMQTANMSFSIHFDSFNAFCNALSSYILCANLGSMGLRADCNHCLIR